MLEPSFPASPGSWKTQVPEDQVILFLPAVDPYFPPLITHRPEEDRHRYSVNTHSRRQHSRDALGPYSAIECLWGSAFRAGGMYRLQVSNPAQGG